MCRLLACLLTLGLVAMADAQYANTTFTGPWLVEMEENYEPAHMYFWFDGAGVITEISMFGGGTGSSDGTYEVNGNGSFSGTIEADAVMPFVGTLTSDSTADLRVIEGMDTLPVMPMTTIADPGALEGDWDGTFITGNGLMTEVTITVDQDGIITNVVGMTGPYGGALFAHGGLFAGMGTTGETGMWNQFMMRGTHDGNTLSGSVSADGAGANSFGTFTLTRQSAVTNSYRKTVSTTAAAAAQLQLNVGTDAAPVVETHGQRSTLVGRALR